MKRILFFVLLFGLNTHLRADMLMPEGVVRALISAARENRLAAFINTTDLLKMASHPRRPLTPEQLLELLRSIPEGELVFAPDKIVVRLEKPAQLDFTLEYRDVPQSSEGKFVVVSVIPWFRLDVAK